KSTTFVSAEWHIKSYPIIPFRIFNKHRNCLMKQLFSILAFASALSFASARADTTENSGPDTTAGLPEVSVSASDPVAFGALSTGAFVIHREGATGDLNVTVSYSGSASNGVDYATLPTSVKIPDGFHAVGLTVQPLNGGDLLQNKWVNITIESSDAYMPGRDHATASRNRFHQADGANVWKFVCGGGEH